METLLSKVGKYEFMVEPFHCDFSHHCFLGHLGNAMLNAADYHSNDRGYGMNYLNGIHKTWVLSRLAIEMEDMPKAYDKIAIETWVEGAMRFFTSRNFAVSSQDGAKVYGYGRSVWAMIDTDSRQPTDILAIKDGLIQQYVDTEKPCPIDRPSRVRMGRGSAFARTFTPRYSDIDVNGHVNSVKYIDHILDLFDMEWYTSHRLKRFEIAYVAESHQGEKLDIYTENASESNFLVRVVKDDAHQTEVARSLLCFE